MYYFDNVYLGQAVDAGANVEIYFNREWYTISDKSDVSDKKQACGEDEYGKVTYIPYQKIQIVKLNSIPVTIEQLQDIMAGKKPDDKTTDSKPEKPEEDGLPMEEPEEETPEEPNNKKSPDLSWYSRHYDLGRLLIKEYKNGNNR